MQLRELVLIVSIRAVESLQFYERIGPRFLCLFLAIY